LGLVGFGIIWFCNTEVTLQLNHTAGHFVGFTRIVPKLALAWSVGGFVAFLLVNVKSFPQSFRV
jgi:hypothetical protein